LTQVRRHTGGDIRQKREICHHQCVIGWHVSTTTSSANHGCAEESDCKLIYAPEPSLPEGSWLAGVLVLCELLSYALSNESLSRTSTVTLGVAAEITSSRFKECLGYFRA
jgi:hypothetical protein